MRHMTSNASLPHPPGQIQFKPSCTTLHSTVTGCLSQQPHNSAHHTDKVISSTLTPDKVTQKVISYYCSRRLIRRSSCCMHAAVLACSFGA